MLDCLLRDSCDKLAGPLELGQPSTSKRHGVPSYAQSLEDESVRTHHVYEQPSNSSTHFHFACQSWTINFGERLSIHPSLALHIYQSKNSAE